MIGVAITTCRRREAFRQVFEAAVKTIPSAAELVVAWDGPSEDDLRWFESEKRAYRWCEVVYGERAGVAANRNRALRALLEHGAELEWVVFLEDDVLALRPGWADLMVAVADCSGQACVSRMPTYAEWPERVQAGERKRAAVNIWIPARFGLEEAERWPRRADLVWNTWASATAQAIRRDAFEKVGLYDEEFGLYGHEHTEWQMRLQAAGLVDKIGHPHIAPEHIAPFLADLDVPPSYQDEYGPEFEEMIAANGRRLGRLAAQHKRRYRP